MTTDLLLSRGELETLTDTVQPARMAAWLRARGWVFEEPRGKGKLPKVARAYFDARMMGREINLPRLGPNLDFLSRRAA